MSKKKVIYYSKINFGNPGSSGIRNKIEGQWIAFNNAGLETDLFYIENYKAYLKTSTGVIEKKFKNKYSKIKFIYIDFINEWNIDKYDTIFIRYFFVHPLAILMLWKIKQKNSNIKIIWDMPTYPYIGVLLKTTIKNFIVACFDFISHPFLKNYSNIIVTVSDHEKIFGIPTIKTSNGINYSSFPIKNETPLLNEFNLIGLANLQYWHGFDRVVNGIKAYKKANNIINVKFHIVGNGDAIPKLKNLVNELSLTDNVIFYGQKLDESLNDIFNFSHMAVGILGLHRTNDKYSSISSLKVREYCVRGIPFIDGFPDTDIDSNFPFWFKVPADDSIIDINEIINYFIDIKNKYPDYSNRMNLFAKEYLTWDVKLKELINWIKNN